MDDAQRFESVKASVGPRQFDTAEDDTASRLTKIIVEHLGVAPADVVPEVLIAGDDEKAGKPNLGADSLDIVELAMAAEDEFNIEIPDEEVTPLNKATFGELVDFIHEKRAGGRS